MGDGLAFGIGEGLHPKKQSTKNAGTRILVNISFLFVYIRRPHVFYPWQQVETEAKLSANNEIQRQIRCDLSVL